MIEVNIIGTGNVAWHLARAFGNENQAVLMQVAGRSTEALKDFKHIARQTVSIEDMEPASVNIIAVSDDHIEEVSNKFSFDNALVVHTSGFTEMNALSSGQRRGVFYPLQSFSKKDAEITFSNIPILVEAENDKDEKTLRELATIISKNVQVINSKQRKHLHIAAVFANNFTNHCYTIAAQLCKDQQVDFNILHSLIEKTTQKAITNGPSMSQTGPAVRKDYQVMTAQEKMLVNPDHQKLYKTLTEAIITTYGKKL